MITQLVIPGVRYDSGDRIGSQKLGLAEGLSSLPPLPDKKYSLIVADFPWSYTLRESDKSHRNRCPYPQMQPHEIIGFPMSDLAEKGCYLLNWVTNNHLPLAIQAVENWGFEYKTLITWVKMTNDRKKIRFGAGHYTRSCTEHVMICRRGKIPSFTKLGISNIPNVIMAPRGEHSVKPQEFWEIADRLAGALDNPGCIELFARQSRKNWDSWGLEANE